MATKKTPVVGRKPGEIGSILPGRTIGWGKDYKGKTKVGLVVDSRPPASKTPQLRATNDDRRPGAPDSLNIGGNGKSGYRLRKSPVR